MHCPRPRASLIDDPAVIPRILTQIGLWREQMGNERGTAPLEEPASDADWSGGALRNPRILQSTTGRWGGIAVVPDRRSSLTLRKGLIDFWKAPRGLAQKGYVSARPVKAGQSPQIATFPQRGARRRLADGPHRQEGT
jgi:hypothetical protein